MPSPFTNYDDDEVMRAIQEYQGSGMEDALKEALTMPPEERKAFIDSITKAYDPERTDLRSDIERNFLEMNQEGPQGIQAGNNPYSVYVAANPLAHAASAYQRGKAGKQMKTQRAELKKLSAEQSAALAKIQTAQAEAIRRSIRPQDEEEDENMPFWMRRY